MKNITTIQETNEAAVAVQDDPACQASPNGLPPQATLAETAIVPTVRKQSSLTFDGVELTDPVEMDNDQLADIVISGVKKFWRIVPYVITLKQRFRDGERDSKNRLKEPIKGCHSWLEFSTKKCDRTPEGIAKAISRHTPQLTDGDPTSPPKPRPAPPWSKTEDGTQIYTAVSALHKAVRDGDEAAAVYWIKQLYFADRKVWKQLHVFAVEDIGLGDLSVKQHMLELEKAAEKCKNDGRHSDLLHVINAVLICCRAKKSRAADNAILWLNENPTWKPADEKEIAALAETDAPQPVIPDKVFDQHTTEGRKKGRKGKAGLEHFKNEAAVLTNESDVAPWQPPVIDIVPAEPPTVTAAETAIAKVYIIRRKADGAIWMSGRLFITAKQWGNTFNPLSGALFESPDDSELKKVLRTEQRFCKKHQRPFDAANYELVEVKATFNLTPVAPTVQPEPPKPTKKRKATKQAAEPPKPKTKQAKNEKKMEAVIDELRRIDSILEVAPVDNEFGAYVDKSNYKLLDKQERLKKKLELLEKAVEAEESDDQPSKETEEKMQARLQTEYEAAPL